MRSPTRPAALLALLALLVLLPAGAAPAAAQEPTPGATRAATAVPAGTRDGRSRLTVTLPGSAPAGPAAISVAVDGRPQPAEAVPLLSDRTATAVVVDCSAAGAPALQPGLSGAAGFVLATPPAARTALVADTAPPVVMAAAAVGPADTLRGLAAMRPGGDRRTAAAVELALDQLPPEDGPRLVVLYTGAPDAQGPPAAELVTRLRAAGAVLAVVVPTADGAVPPYWSAVADATGGVAVAARESSVIAAFDALGTALRARWLVTVPTPARLPAAAVVRVATETGPVEAAVEVPAASGAASGESGGGPGPAAALAVAGVLAVLAGGTVLVVRRRPGRRPGWRTPGRPAGPDGGARGPGRPAATDAAERAAPAWRAARTAWNVPDRPDPAADRSALTAAIRHALRAGGPVFLHPEEGATGVGTTTAMVDLAHRDRRDHDIAWWVPAADPPLVADRLAELAELLGVARPTDTAERATDRLLAALGRRPRWLLIFDDAAGPRQLGRFLPTGGHVLISSSDPGWAQHARPVPVPPLRRAESTGLLCAHRPGLSAAEADRVAATLHDAPAAVDLAGATLAATGMSVATYLRLLDERAPEPAPPAAAACAVALDRLAVDSPPTLTLLTLLAWLGPDPVPLALLGADPGLLPAPIAYTRAGSDRLDDLLAAATRRGLARVGTGAGGRTVTLSPAATALLTARSADDGTGAAGWAATAVRLLGDVVPADAADPAGWPTWRVLLPHVLAVTDPGRPLDDVPVEVGRLLGLAACYLRQRGQPRAALALSEDAHDLLRRRLGPGHPDTLAAARVLVEDPQAPGEPERPGRPDGDVGEGAGG